MSNVSEKSPIIHPVRSDLILCLSF